MLEAVRFEQVDVILDNRLVLQDIHFSIADKEFLGIIGPNGGGKTTLLKTMLGLIKPARGSITLYGKPIQSGKKYVGYVPQYSTYLQEYPISVFEVVLLGRIGRKSAFGSYGENDKRIVKESLDRVGLFHLHDRTANDLSGGERQRMLIARALAVEPKLLLLDEPTASVDTKTSGGFYDLLHELNEEMTIILVTHDTNVVSRYVKKIACLNKSMIYHDSKEIQKEVLEAVYGCPVEMIAHGVPHRVLNDHEG